MNRGAKVLTALLLAQSIMIGTAPAQAALALYDDFNDPSHVVRSDLWSSADNYSTGGAGPGRLDAFRFIDAILFPTSDPKLVIAKRFVLQAGATAGFDLDGLTARNAANPVGIQADVAMLSCVLSNAAFLSAGVQFYGFNDGTSPGPGNSIGDIFTRLRVGCVNTNQASITWNVFRCTDAACNGATSLGSGSFGAVSIGQKTTLTVSKSGSSLVFTAAGQTQTFPVPGNPTAAPRLPFTGLRARIDPTTPAPGGEFIVVATFDNVMIDQ